LKIKNSFDVWIFVFLGCKIKAKMKNWLNCKGKIFLMILNSNIQKNKKNIINLKREFNEKFNDILKHMKEWKEKNYYYYHNWSYWMSDR